MEYIQNNAELGRVASALADVSLFAADTEAAGYHRYHDRICLLQISTREDTFIVDTLALASLSDLSPHFADPAKEVVLHDADYDLRLLARDYGIHVAGLFDTKLAAQLIGEQAFGLGALVEKYLGRKLDKKHQRADWAQRPLPAEMLEYAAEDTRHLPQLRDRLEAELERLGRRHWAEEEFGLREQARWDVDEEAEAYLRVKNTRDLTPRQMAALRELYAWREEAAQKRDVATFRVISNELLVASARALPADARSVASVENMPPTIADRYGADISGAIRRALALSDDDLPKRVRLARRPPPDAEFDALVEKLKRARDAAAESLNLERGFLMPRQQLEAAARLKPRSLNDLLQIPDMRHWQVEALGEKLLHVLKR
jgi:ribonuclease D